MGPLSPELVEGGSWGAAATACFMFLRSVVQRRRRRETDPMLTALVGRVDELTTTFAAHESADRARFEQQERRMEQIAREATDRDTATRRDVIDAVDRAAKRLDERLERIDGRLDNVIVLGGHKS